MPDEGERQAAVGRREIDRRGCEDERARFIARFIERQRLKRWWISLFDIADQHGLSAGPAGSDAYDKVRERGLKLLSGSMLNGEFECAGSKILYLAADISLSDSGVYSAPRRWLAREPYRVAIDSAAPSLPLDVLGCCWLPRKLAKQWIETHGARWPTRFDPASTWIATDRTNKASSPLPRPTIAYGAVRKWYEQYLEYAKTRAQEPSETDDWKAARQKFGDKVRRNQVRDLRRELAPAEWRRQGRRRKVADKRAAGKSAG
jgi:hypothetical protein